VGKPTVEDAYSIKHMTSIKRSSTVLSIKTILPTFILKASICFFDMLASGQRTYIEAMESFVSDFLEDYAEWVMSSPEIVPFEIVCEKVRRL